MRPPRQTLNHEIVYPLVHQQGLPVCSLEDRQTLAIEGLHIEEIVAEGNETPFLVIRPLQVRQDHRIEQADESDESHLEHDGLVGRDRATLAEGSDDDGRIAPVASGTFHSLFLGSQRSPDVQTWFRGSPLQGCFDARIPPPRGPSSYEAARIPPRSD